MHRTDLLGSAGDAVGGMWDETAEDLSDRDSSGSWLFRGGLWGRHKEYLDKEERGGCCNEQHPP